MNNAFILDSLEDDSPKSQTETNAIEEARLTRLIEAIAGLYESKHWQVLEELHFKGEEERVTRLLLSEAKKSQIEEKEIYKLQGEIKWAKRYGNLKDFAKYLKNQLEELKKKHG